MTHDYVLVVHSIQHIEVQALEKGYLQDVLVDEGQLVSEASSCSGCGPALRGRGAPGTGRGRVRGDEYRNTKALADSNGSPQRTGLAKARYDKAKAELDVAQHLGFTDIRAPFGIVGRFHVRKGSLLDEGELLTELSGQQQHVGLLQRAGGRIPGLREGRRRPARARRSRLLWRTGPCSGGGSITAIESDFDNTTGNIAFRATFPNPDGLLRHGQTGNILIGRACSRCCDAPEGHVRGA